MLPCRTPNMQSFTAGADLSAKQFCFVKAGTVAGTVVAIAAVTDKIIGILQNAPASGEPADVACPGGGAFLKLAASAGTLAAGGPVATDAAGKGVQAVNFMDSVGAYVDAIGSAPANADVIAVFVTTSLPYGPTAATVGAMTAKSPETDAEAGFLSIKVGGTAYEIPFYAIA